MHGNEGGVIDRACVKHVIMAISGIFSRLSLVFCMVEDSASHVFIVAIRSWRSKDGV